MNTDSPFALWRLRWRVRVRRWHEAIRCLVRYYPNWRFSLADLGLHLQYLVSNPYRMVSRYFSDSENPYRYGETPLTTLERIATAANVTAEDTVFELGCGPGRTCLWLNRWIGCRVVGVDLVPSFIKRLNRLARWLKLNNLEGRIADLAEVDLAQASVVYWYGTGFPDSIISGVGHNLMKLSSGARVISVSYPLTEYSSDQRLRCTESFEVPFPWGKGTVYVHTVA